MPHNFRIVNLSASAIVTIYVKIAKLQFRYVVVLVVRVHTDGAQAQLTG